MAQAINIKIATLYTEPPGPTSADKSTWPGVVGGQLQASVGNSQWDLQGGTRLVVAVVVLVVVVVEPNNSVIVAQAVPYQIKSA